MKARYKGCKKEIAKLQLACDENVSTYDQLSKDYDGALTREKGLHERVEDLEEEKQELEEVNTKQANQIKQLEEELKKSEEETHQLRVDREKFAVECGNKEMLSHHESESELKNDNHDKMINVDCESSVELDRINQSEHKQSNVDESQNTNPSNVSLISMQVNVQSDTVKTCVDNYDEKMSNNSYSRKVGNNKEIVENKLNLIPTVINEIGQEYVIFDEELVIEGSKK
ncbi:hypothetical protein Tco_0001202 [Tanacetum coccineum]